MADAMTSTVTNAVLVGLCRAYFFPKEGEQESEPKGSSVINGKGQTMPLSSVTKVTPTPASSSSSSSSSPSSSSFSSSSSSSSSNDAALNDAPDENTSAA